MEQSLDFQRCLDCVPRYQGAVTRVTQGLRECAYASGVSEDMVSGVVAAANEVTCDGKNFCSRLSLFSKAVLRLTEQDNGELE